MDIQKIKITKPSNRACPLNGKFEVAVTDPSGVIIGMLTIFQHVGFVQRYAAAINRTLSSYKNVQMVTASAISDEAFAKEAMYMKTEMGCASTLVQDRLEMLGAIC